MSILSLGLIFGLAPLLKGADDICLSIKKTAAADLGVSLANVTT
jgi:hypothetical protein